LVNVHLKGNLNLTALWRTITTAPCLLSTTIVIWQR
jgi:hypothetical protein